VVDKKRELIARGITLEQAVIRQARRCPMKICKERSTHIRGNKKVAIIRKGILLQIVPRSHLIRSDNAIGKHDLAGGRLPLSKKPDGP
jgi:hypothetical protein